MTKILALVLTAGLVLLTPVLALPVLLTAGLTLACTTSPTTTTATSQASLGAAGRGAAEADPSPPSVSRPRASTNAVGVTAPPAPTASDAAAPATAAATAAAATVQAGSAMIDCLTGPGPPSGPGVRARLLVPAGTAGDVAAAVTRALSYVGLSTGYAHHCDRLACRAYNYANSGYETATAHWYAMTAAGHAHPGDRCPPVGALLFWDTRDPAGHVAFVAASDPGCDPDRIQVVTNDYGDAATGNHGGVYLVSLAAIEAGFVTRAGYRGWSDPICAGTQLPAGTRHPLPS